MNQAFKGLITLYFPIICLLTSTSIFSQSIPGLRAGVVAHWSFDENFKADFGGETFDLTSSALPPVISGNDAVFKAYAAFNSANSNYLKTLTNVNADDADFSFYVRYMPTSAIASGNRYFVMESSLTDHAISFGLRNDAQSSNVARSELYTRNTLGNTYFHQPDAGGNYGVSVNNWQNVIVNYTRSDKTYRIYINGVAATGTLVHPTGVLRAGGLVIGSFRNNDARFWNGNIDEVTIWNRILIPAEISAMQNTKIKIALQKAALTTVNSSSASFLISSGENLTAYYKVIPASSTCPTAQNLRTDVQATTLPLNTTSTTISAVSLTPSTNYKLCHVARDAANLMGAVLETGFSTSASLPLTWKSFKAGHRNQDVHLQWETSSEYNTKDFFIQHSVNSVDFTNVGTVAASVNSEVIKRYQFIHKNPGNGAHYYRIEQSDIDGKTTYSNVAEITMDVKTATFTVLSNPVQGNQIRIKLAGKSKVSLFTTGGKRVWNGNLASGLHTIDVSAFAKGIYLLQVNEATERVALQ